TSSSQSGIDWSTPVSAAAEQMLLAMIPSAMNMYNSYLGATNALLYGGNPPPSGMIVPPPPALPTPSSGSTSNVQPVSTVPEVITAVHCGMKVLAIALICNINDPDHMKKIEFEEVLRVAEMSTPHLRRFWKELIGRLEPNA
ncbi:MAG: hypothetical protein ACK4WB_10025, partial [Desulfatiglandales bacterium]